MHESHGDCDNPLVDSTLKGFPLTFMHLEKKLFEYPGVVCATISHKGTIETSGSIWQRGPPKSTDAWPQSFEGQSSTWGWSKSYGFTMIFEENTSKNQLF